MKKEITIIKTKDEIVANNYTIIELYDEKELNKLIDMKQGVIFHNVKTNYKYVFIDDIVYYMEAEK